MADFTPADQTRYLDWCSARILERIDALTPEAAWRLANIDAPDSTDDPWELVRRLTEALSRELPSYEEWRELARREPAKVDRDLIGFEGDRAPALRQFVSPPDPPAHEVFAATWLSELPVASRRLVPSASFAENAPGHRAERHARARVWQLLRRATGWPAAPARLLLDALTTELRLWRVAGSGEPDELRRWLERTEERFLASTTVVSEGVVFPILLPPVLADAFTDATALVTDGRRVGVRTRAGTIDWFETTPPAEWRGEKPPPFPEDHPLFRVLYDYVRRYGVERPLSA